MRWLRALVRVFGWLLTPVLAWAASFFGAVAGALLAMQVREPRNGILVTAVAGGAVSFLAIHFWLRFLRRHREVQEALAVSAEGTPLLVDEELGEEGKDSGRS
jgi:positive regulator of sigma E activity